MRRPASAAMLRRLHTASRTCASIQSTSAVRNDGGMNSTTGGLASSSQSLSCSVAPTECDEVCEATRVPRLLVLSPCFEGRQRPLRATLVGWLVGFALCLVGGATVVFCRPYDTPPYLIPFYLRDVRSRFLHYASVRKRKGGPMYMTVEDFVLALLASPEKTLPSRVVVQDLQRLFQSMDANGDGYISYPEFRFLMSLLTSDARELELLFLMADSDRLGTLSIEQFANVLRGATRDEAVVRSLLKPSTRNNGIVRALFGDEAAPRRCTLSDITTIIHSIRTEVWKAEFRQYDVEQDNCITAEQFASLIARQVLGSHLPHYIADNIRRLRGSGDVVTLDMWLGLNEVMLHADELTANVEMFSSSGMSVSKIDFRRLISIAGVPELPDATIDIVFSVFDKDGNGSMEFDEFLSIMHKKVTYHYTAPPRERKSMPRRFVECSTKVLADLFP